MSRNELLTPALLRIDGRRPFEFRSMEIHLASNALPASSTASSSIASSSSSSSSSTTGRPDGACRLVQGLNDVTCSVYGPRETGASGSGTGAGGGGGGGGQGVEGASLEFEVMNENWSSVGQERRANRSARNDRRSQDTTSALSSLFYPLVNTSLYPRTSSIQISLRVTSSDGSLLPTLINATTLALVTAGIPLRDYCLATCLAFHPTVRGVASENVLLLDPTSTEESDLPTLTVAVTPRDGKVASTSLDAGRGKVEGHRIAGAIDAGVEVLRGRYLEEIETAVRGWARQLRDVGTAASGGGGGGGVQ